VPESRAPVLTVDRLTVEFATADRVVNAVRNLAFHIDRGETIAVVGESGSGKSVTALSVMRLVEHGGGRIVGGRMTFARPGGSHVDLAAAKAHTMREIRGAEIAMIFQEPMTSLNPVFPVGEQIAESIRLHQRKDTRAARAEALRMLEQVRIPEARSVLDRFPHQLSGGMRQRVMIAMALSCRPSLLIADEPTTALDVTIQAQILTLVRLLQDEMHMAVMFITHDMGVVAEVADRVVVMYRGEKVEEGTAETIFKSPTQPYTRALLAAVPKLGALSNEDLPRKFPLPGAAPLPAESAPATARDGRRVGAPLLRVRRLTTRFDVRSGFFGRVRRRVHAVEQVSFDLAAGETLALVGESGCGKSTTGRSLLRLVDIAGGSIEFEGKDIAALPANALRPVRRDIQMIFQDPFASLDPRPPSGSRSPNRCTSTVWRADAKPRSALRGCSSTSGLPASMRAAIRTNSPAASGSGLQSRAHLRCSHGSSSPTKRCPRSTCRSRHRSSTCCSTCRRSSELPICSFRTTWPSSSASVTASP